MTPIDVSDVIRERIRFFATRDYDWDGKEGLPIRPDVRGFLDVEFCNRNTLSFYGLPEPSVTLQPDGAVNIVFTSKKKHLLLECPCKNVISYRKVFQDHQTQVAGYVRIVKYQDIPDAAKHIARDRERFAEVQDLLDWFTGRPLRHYA